MEVEMIPGKVSPLRLVALDPVTVTMTLFATFQGPNFPQRLETPDDLQVLLWSWHCSDVDSEMDVFEKRYTLGHCNSEEKCCDGGVHVASLCSV